MPAVVCLPPFHCCCSCSCTGSSQLNSDDTSGGSAPLRSWLHSAEATLGSFSRRSVSLARCTTLGSSSDAKRTIFPRHSIARGASSVKVDANLSSAPMSTCSRRGDVCGCGGFCFCGCGCFCRCASPPPSRSPPCLSAPAFLAAQLERSEREREREKQSSVDYGIKIV